MSTTKHYAISALLLLVTFTYGCAGSTGPSNSAAASSAADTSFNNILVLAMADNYDGRAQYERAVASGLRKSGVSATPYHEAVGGSGQVSRERARELIDANGFDSVLVTRVRDSKESVEVEQDSIGSTVTRRDDRPVDFFRYDYEELDEPGEISLLVEATLDTDLYRASDSSIVWSFSWTSKGADNVGLLIDEASDDVIRRLKRDRVIGK